MLRDPLRKLRARFSFFFLVIIPALSSHAQKLSGTVLDSKTNKPMPYVHIGVLNKNMGVISAENGKFEIDLSKAEKNDQLLFSMLGYEIVKTRIGDVSVFDHAEIKLVQKPQQLKEV